MSDALRAALAAKNEAESRELKAAQEADELRALADSEGTRAVNYLRRARKAEEALRELVALKDLKDRLRALHEMGHGTDYDDYHQRQPIAWAQARAVLGPNVRAKRALPVQELK